MTKIDGADDKTRKAVPLATGCFDYFPDALVAVAELSKIGNDKHNPGQPLHWSRGKSNDHPDCLARHFVDRGKIDSDGVRHSVKVAWRALAILQLEIEASYVEADMADVLADDSLACDNAALAIYPRGFGARGNLDRPATTEKLVTDEALSTGKERRHRITDRRAVNDIPASQKRWNSAPTHQLGRVLAHGRRRTDSDWTVLPCP